jgi:hypothetical protein
MAGLGFQVASRLVDREPPDVNAAARFCTRLVLGGMGALPKRRSRRSTAPARKARAGAGRKRTPT